MKLQKRKIAMLAGIALVLTLLTAGCGNTAEDATVDNQASQATTELAGTETEMENAANTEETAEEQGEPTEVVAEEETETEEEIIANGYVELVEGSIALKDYPTQMEYGEDIELIDSGDKVGIIEEYYCEEQQYSYYRVRLENGKTGYIPKECVRLEE